MWVNGQRLQGFLDQGSQLKTDTDGYEVGAKAKLRYLFFIIVANIFGHEFRENWFRLKVELNINKRDLTTWVGKEVGTIWRPILMLTYLYFKTVTDILGLVLEEIIFA